MNFLLGFGLFSGATSGGVSRNVQFHKCFLSLVIHRFMVFYDFDGFGTHPFVWQLEILGILPLTRALKFNMELEKDDFQKESLLP